jgi:hypothetical protein
MSTASRTGVVKKCLLQLLYLELEHRLWKKLDDLEKQKSIEQKYSAAYENIENLVNKFY